MKITKKTKTVFIAAVMVIAAISGVWLLTAPSRERQAIESGQEALLQYVLTEIESSRNASYPTSYPLDYFFEPLPDLLPDLPQSNEALTNDGLTDDGLTDEPLLYTLRPYTHDEILAASEETEPTNRVPLPKSAFPTSIQGIGILTIERIDLRLPVAEGVEYATLRIAPGRVPQTALVGDIGNAVIAGHRNYAFGSMFNRLDELEIGDIINFTAINGEEMAFVVFEIAIIEPYDQIAFIQPINDSIITLYTCEPIRTATHRLIIRAQRV